jgi:putative addiction module component (TIGR02574 family)
MSLASIQDEIDKLNPSERVALIDVLWDSLDEERIKEIEAKWTSESEDRIDAFERGQLPAVDGPTALKELRSNVLRI